ncbi:MAG: AAA family ATPase [Puniceicoccales bacterium]|nr:AAA family ATPase [Puniceicoccales bacterium]
MNTATTDYFRSRLAALREQDALAPYAWHFAQTVATLAPGDNQTETAPDILFLAATLAAHHTVANKHVCLRLGDIATIGSVVLADAPSDDIREILETPLPPDFQKKLLAPNCAFAVVNGNADADADADALFPQDVFKPLVLEGGRLYLQRYWVLENRLAAILRYHTATSHPSAHATCGTGVSPVCAEGTASPSLADAAPPTAAALPIRTRLDLDTDQLAAVAKAATSPFCVITGAPGTGKTTIIAVVLAALLHANPALDIRLCAPTGKAAARMKEAVRDEIARNLVLDDAPEVRQKLAAVETGTIHRLLRFNPAKNAFTCDAANPFSADVLVVDEVSMVDLPLLVALLEATPPACRVLLLGDKDQLAAVETGAALADICEAWRQRGDQTFFAELSQSHRFSAGSPIARLKDAINSGDADAAWETLAGSDTAAAHAPAAADSSHAAALALAPAPRALSELETRLAAHLRGHSFRDYPAAASLTEAFRLFDSFRLLCATRRGPCGVEAANRAMQRIFRMERYGRGFPLMITENDYFHNLHNGDIGLCWPDAIGEIRVWFPDESTAAASAAGAAEAAGAGAGAADAAGDTGAADAAGDAAAVAGFRDFSLVELPAHEPVFAMTVHKAQGSGFGEVLFILAAAQSRLLTRELLYTGLTRAKLRCVFWADEAFFKQAVSTPTLRSSGLAEKI